MVRLTDSNSCQTAFPGNGIRFSGQRSPSIKARSSIVRVLSTPPPPRPHTHTAEQSLPIAKLRG